MSNIDLTDFEIYLKVKTLPEPEENEASWRRLWESMRYSLFSGGKRYRPSLVLATAETLRVPAARVHPWAAAIEMIHTYSLIHDDLPCMDNDETRRGQPTNHIKFGEDTALLAGDALLTEAFGHLAVAYAEEPMRAVQLLQLLAEATGARGMVGGQLMDIALARGTGQAPIDLIHRLKTGALIRVSVEGVGILANLPPAQRKACRDLGEAIGFAFQLADDLIDAAGAEEECSFVTSLGVEGTKGLLRKVTLQAHEHLGQLGGEKGALAQLIDFNFKREH